MFSIFYSLLAARRHKLGKRITVFDEGFNVIGLAEKLATIAPFIQKHHI